MWSQLAPCRLRTTCTSGSHHSSRGTNLRGSRYWARKIRSPYQTSTRRRRSLRPQGTWLPQLPHRRSRRDSSRGAGAPKYKLFRSRMRQCCRSTGRSIATVLPVPADSSSCRARLSTLPEAARRRPLTLRLEGSARCSLRAAVPEIEPCTRRRRRSPQHLRTHLRSCASGPTDRRSSECTHLALQLATEARKARRGAYLRPCWCSSSRLTIGALVLHNESAALRRNRHTSAKRRAASRQTPRTHGSSRSQRPARRAAARDVKNITAISRGGTWCLPPPQRRTRRRRRAAIAHTASRSAAPRCRRRCATQSARRDRAARATSALVKTQEHCSRLLTRERQFR
jgi:hypothetical protein